MSILKTVVYSLLFLLLSPGFLINLYPYEKGYFLSEETSYYALFLHTFLLGFLLVAFEQKRYLDIKNIKTQLTQVETREVVPLVMIILFVLLSPGIIFTIPSGDKGIFFSKQTSYLAVLIHTIIFIFSFGFSVELLDKYKHLFKF